MKNPLDFSGKGQTEHCRPDGQHEYMQWEQQQRPDSQGLDWIKEPFSHAKKYINK